MLARRDHGVTELKRKLVEKGFSEKDSEEAIEKLLGMELLDDARYAKGLADASVRNGRGVGPKLFSDLRKRGIAPEIARHATDEATAVTPEHEALSSIVSKRFTSFDPTNASLKEKHRVFGYLQRRGFSLASIISFFRDQEE